MYRSCKHAAKGLLLAMLILSPVVASQDAQIANGQLRNTGAGAQVWNAHSGNWVSPVEFWLDYAAGNQGKFWGRDTDYPAYDQVSEHDTLLIEVEGGPCLMYFFHNRWRRAQDVRRWDPGFNQLPGCATVFR
jgi:hypothetical protein